MKRKQVIWGVLVVACVVLAMFARSISNEGVTPLMIAAKDGDIATVDQMITEGDDFDAQSAYGWTALMFAASQGHEDVAQRLVEAGADTDVNSKAVPASFATTGDYPPTTALFEAISNKHFTIARYLLDKNALVDAGAMAVAGAQGNPELLRAMLESGAQVDEMSENQYYRTALSAAARHGNTENLEWLLANGAKPNLRLPHSSNLSEAVRGLNPTAVSMLLGAGAEVDALIGSRKSTALQEAIYMYVGNKHERQIQVVAVLLANGANPDYVPDEFARSLIDHVNISIQKGIEGSRDTERSPEVRERYRRSLNADQAILELLKSHQR